MFLFKRKEKNNIIDLGEVTMPANSKMPTIIKISEYNTNDYYSRVYRLKEGIQVDSFVEFAKQIAGQNNAVLSECTCTSVCDGVSRKIAVFYEMDKILATDRWNDPKLSYQARFCDKASKEYKFDLFSYTNSTVILWRVDKKETTDNPAAKATAAVPKKAEPPASNKPKKEPVQTEKKKKPGSLGKYITNIYREEELAGMEFPEKLVKYLPSPDKIIITSYGDDTFKGWKRVGVNHIDKGAYISWCNNSDDSDQIFAETYHPFIQQFTDNTYDCAKKVSRCFSRKPSSCAVTENSLLAELDMGYVNNGYYESTEVLGYGEHQSESYHDGGGSSSEEWGIYPASVTAQELESSDKYERIRIADLPGDIYYCEAIWKEGEHIYLVGPLGIPGVFEYFYYSTYRYDYDSDEEVKNCGVPYSESERFKKKAEEKKTESKQIGSDLLSPPAAADENSEPITEPTAKEIDVRTLEDLIQGLMPFVQKHGGNIESAAQLANYISGKFHAINSPGKWYFDEVHAEYRYRWCACSPISDSYDEGFIHWEITQIDKVGEGEIINNELLNNSKTYNDEVNFICSNPFGLSGLFRIKYLNER